MTEEDYKAGFAWLKLKSPNNPLLRTLGSGYSKMNVIYLAHSLKGIGSNPQGPTKAEKEVELDASDPKLIVLHKERRTLFTHRAKLSNNFHTCTTDEERADNSDRIALVQRKIEVCLRAIDHYKKTGELPAEPDKEPSLTGVELMKKHQSVLSNISIKKRNLRRVASATDEKTKQQIDKWEKSLKSLEREKEELERIIARESV